MARVSRAPLAELQSFIDDFTASAAERRDNPFTLGADAESYWSVDTRFGVSQGNMLQRAAKLMLDHVVKLGLKPDVIAGIGIAGRSFANSMAIKAAESGSLSSAWLNDDPRDIDPLNGYGVHGAPVSGSRVLLIDSVASSDGPQVVPINMLRRRGAIVTDMLCMTAISGGRAAETLDKAGVELHWLFDYDESTKLFRPAAHLLNKA